MRLLRPTLLSLLPLAVAAAPLVAQEHEAAGPVSLLSPSYGLMFWTLIIFVLLLAVLTKFAFPPIIAAVEERERKLQEALDSARADREAAAATLAEQRALLETARTQAQQLIADGRAAGEKMRTELLEQTRRQQQEMLERARHEIEAERDRAIAELRREAVDLAIAGASKVIEKNLDDASNRQLIDSFLATIPSAPATR
ncbi:MAG TPA: F0F1 ATP synthase subunit B [Gemmatimonadaceae bacterium]|nr:F0F1 ATP synthase subunit B [Gemmatimonadaceae bacterium]